MFGLRREFTSADKIEKVKKMKETNIKKNKN